MKTDCRTPTRPRLFRWGVVFLVVLCWRPSSLAAVETAPRRPNVLLIVADDLGSVDLNCFGSTDLHTPHLDRLAAEGLRFTQFYVAAPVCSPSRGAILTGRRPQRNGVANNGGSFHADETTIAEMLKPVGYRTASIGKWHLGEKTGGPNGEGFDEFYGHLGGCIENYRHNVLDWDAGEEAVRHHDLWRNQTEIFEPDVHFGELLVREAGRFIERSDDPFFLYLAFNNPHYPVQPLSRWFEHYKSLEEPRRSYAAFVSTLDEQIGRVLSTLEESEKADQTFVFFLSDHGHSVETRNVLFVDGAAKANPAGGSAGPYRGHKFTVWEGGIRVPALARWPGQIPAGETRSQVARSMDLLPTIAAMSGAELPAKPLDGESLLPVFASATAPSPHADDVLAWSRNDKHWAVRIGDWKLVHDGKTQVLSNLSQDVSDTRDLSAEHPDQFQRLTTAREAWAAEVRTTR